MEDGNGKKKGEEQQQEIRSRLARTASVKGKLHGLGTWRGRSR